MLQNVETRKEKLAYSVKEAAKAISVSPSHLRSEINAGRLKAKKYGMRVLILDSELKAYLESCEDYTDWKSKKNSQSNENNSK